MSVLNALRVASDTQSWGMGVLVCLNDEIHAAREVTKTSTSRLNAFQSPTFGSPGQIDGGEVHYYRPVPAGGLGAGDAGHQAQGDGPGRRRHPESQKTRVSLSLALTQTNQIEQLERMFATY
ncbi:asparaginase domain-containing protein [Paraburkholderia fungorum]